jgi:hypothetical protein
MGVYALLRRVKREGRGRDSCIVIGHGQADDVRSSALELFKLRRLVVGYTLFTYDM